MKNQDLKNILAKMRAEEKEEIEKQKALVSDIEIHTVKPIASSKDKKRKTKIKAKKIKEPKGEISNEKKEKAGGSKREAPGIPGGGGKQKKGDGGNGEKRGLWERIFPPWF